MGAVHKTIKIKENKDLDPGEITFDINEGKKNVLRLKANGDIYVWGRLADNDKQIVDGLRDWLKENGSYPKEQELTLSVVSKSEEYCEDCGKYLLICRCK